MYMIKRKKKAGLFLASVLFTLALAACPCFCRAAFQADEEETPEELAQLYARSAVLMDADSGRVLFEKDGKTARPIASTTKIMTCILALEEGKPDLVCSVSEKAASQPEVRLGVREGETYLLEDLLYSLMLESHNDSAVVIAENTAGSVEAFAGLMNKKSEEIGCQDTYFITPNGLDASDEGGTHSATAEDLARILRYCIMESPKREAFLTVTRTDSYSFTDLSGQRSFSLQNHNAFLSMMEGALTGKTGFTADAGYCYVCAYKDNDRTFIVALLACGWPDNKTYKWSDAKHLLDYARASYTKQDILICPKVFNIKIKNGSKSSIDILFDKKLSACISDNDNVEVVYNIPSSIAAPVNNECIIGNVCVNINDKEIQRYNIYCNENIKKVSFISKITQKVKKL